MVENTVLVKDLQSLNRISQTLNKAVDVKTALNSALPILIDLMGFETGWVFVHNPSATNRWAGRGFELAAHHQLPPAMDLKNPDVWQKGCNCQNSCKNGELHEAYNEIRCSRLAEADGQKNGLAVHASVPLKSNSGILGILNVAAPTWDSFDQRALELLATVGDQIGFALERARLHDMLSEQYIQEQSALLLLSQKLLKRTSIEGLENFIVNEAMRLLDVDACALVLPDPIENDHLYFLAQSGWRKDPVSAQKRIPISLDSKIGEVMLTQNSMVSKLNESEPQSKLDKWAVREGFKMIAAVPLIVDGQSGGVLVVHTRQERHFLDSDLRFLNLLANQAAIALEAWRFIQQEIQLRRTERELAFGREIQHSMLPKNCPQVSGWEFATAYEAARKVGGDFYDFFQFIEKPGLWGIVIADVSDKGVPAALYMVLSRTTIRNTAQVGRSPSMVLEKTNRYILEDSQADMFLSAFYATLDIESGRLTYSNAGHNHPLLWKSSEKELVTLSQHGILLGVVENVYLEDHQIDIQPGDCLILYTDGITEAVNEVNKEFGEDRLKSLLSDSLEKKPEIQGEELVDLILDAVINFTSNVSQFDDRTLLVIKRSGQFA